MEQRERFIHDHRVALYTMVELCARYGISRKTGYKWREQFEEVADGIWSIHFCRVLLGRIDERDYIIRA